MDDQNIATTDVPVDNSQEPTTTDQPTESVDTTDEQPVEQSTDVQEQPQPQAQYAPAEEEEDYGYPEYQLPDRSPIDFSNLPVGDDGLIDPNSLAETINNSIAQVEERAIRRAQQSFQEQQAETKAWDKAFEKYPELKGNKELRDMVQNSRMGELTAALNRPNIDPNSIKLKTPMQVADSFFKHFNTAKQEGMKQATTNTVVQQSAYTESASRRGSDKSEAKNKAYSNINNPNKEVAKQARNDLLKSMLWGDN